MPKRKDYEEEFAYLKHKMKKLKRKIDKKCKNSASLSSLENVQESDETASPVKEVDFTDLIEEPQNRPEETLEDIQMEESNIPLPLVEEENKINVTPNPHEEEDPLDEETLRILGEDPSSSEKHGTPVRAELASRLQHITTQGLSKEARKALTDHYLTPENCLLIDAPKMNPEIKAAVPEQVAKRDKGIETKQKQLASAISCLSQVLNTLLATQNKNNNIIQRIMDAQRILCDIQHGDSVTRRNFVLFSVKKEMKEHLNLTKIDSMLFSTNLAETLKSAKAVNKSGTELKADNTFKPVSNNLKKDKPAPLKPLNRRVAPAAARRPAGPPHREYAAPRAPPPQAQPGRSSKPLLHRAPPAPPHRRTH